jgi:hypothetical protein
MSGSCAWFLGLDGDFSDSDCAKQVASYLYGRALGLVAEAHGLPVITIENAIKARVCTVRQ